MLLIDEAYQQAIKSLKKCETRNGIFASGKPHNYDAVWARDSMIALLGGATVGDTFKKVFQRSLVTLSKNQSKTGQIPNCVGDFNIDRGSVVTYTTIDSSLWYLIGHYVYQQAYHDNKLFKKYQKNIERVFFWLECQDTGEDGLPDQHPTSDWQDAFPHKYGQVINTLALYYRVLKFAKKNKQAKLVKKTVNNQGRKDLAMFNNQRGYYLPWIWKNHDGDREHESWFDSLGNLLAIVFGLADHKHANSILRYIVKNKIDKPWPVKAMWPPLKPGDPEWHSYFAKCEAIEPFRYLNAGIWPYIGGFYVVSLVKAKKFKQAQRALEQLAKTNQLAIKGEWDFNECLHGQTGKPTGSPWQAWSIGMYLYAYQCVKKKKVVFFG